MKDWIDWKGHQPLSLVPTMLPVDATVDVRFRDGRELYNLVAGVLDWRTDIIAYRLHEPAATDGAKLEPVVLTYTNYRGETAQRTIVPRSVRFGSTEWHPEPQWLLLAFDVDKQADREFALRDFGKPPSPTPNDAKPYRYIFSDGFHDWLSNKPITLEEERDGWTGTAVYAAPPPPAVADNIEARRGEPSGWQFAPLVVSAKMIFAATGLTPDSPFYSKHAERVSDTYWSMLAACGRPPSVGQGESRSASPSQDDADALRAENARLRPDQLPRPETLIEYAGGSVAALMFHYATEADNLENIAKEQGFDVRFLWLEHDTAAADLAEEYAEGSGDVVGKWSPPVPEGWLLGAKHDTDGDGPIAIFIRHKDRAALSAGEGK